MIDRFLRFIESLVYPGGNYGSAENPEILDGTDVRSPFRFSKFKLISLLLVIMAVVSMPALLTLSGSYWLFESATQNQSLLAWLALFLTAPLTFAACLFAFFVDTTLLAGIMAIMRGRNVMRVQFGTSSFTSARPRYRDVTPEATEILPPKDDF